MSPAQVSDSSEISKYEQKEDSKERKSDDESNQQKSSDVTIDQTNVKIEEPKKGDNCMSLAEQKRRNQRMEDFRVYVTMIIIVLLAVCIVILKVSMQNVFVSLLNENSTDIET